MSQNEQASAAPVNSEAEKKEEVTPILNKHVDAASSSKPKQQQQHRTSVMNLVGNTPLMRLNSISDALGCNVFGKCEWMNPGGSVKDRAVRGMIEALEKSGRIDPSRASEYTLIEASGGNTAVSLAMFCRIRGYKCVVTMTDTITMDKVRLCTGAGAEVVRCPVVPFSDTEKHFYHTAKRISEERGEKAIWINQFENTANYGAHQASTGPEIAQALRANVENELTYSSKLDLFVSAVGTGGTMGGISSYFKAEHPRMNSQFWVAECIGGGTKHFVETGSYEGAPSGKSFVEGIGITRLTIGFQQAAPIVNGGVSVSDEEAAKMFHYLMMNEGICVGPSASLNVAGLVKVAKKLNLGPDANIVTILCDSGERYKNTLLNDEWWLEKGYEKPDADPTSGDRAESFKWIAPA